MGYCWWVKVELVQDQWIQTGHSICRAKRRMPVLNSVLPLRVALLEEGCDALVGVLFQQIVDHHLLRNVIGSRAVQLDLSIERGLADCQGLRAGRGNLAGEVGYILLQLIVGDHAIDEA